jgi:hypothetical protein
MATFDPDNYGLTLKRRDATRAWSWVIRKAGAKHPIRRSLQYFSTEEEAREDGSRALDALIDVLRGRHLQRVDQQLSVAGAAKSVDQS